MNKVKIIKFNNAFELATWINKNIADEIMQEIFMKKGIKNNYVLEVSTLFIKED